MFHTNVFGRLREANLTVRSSKCDLAFEEVHCLGHIFGNGIVKPDPKKVHAMVDFPLPINKKGLRSFLGLVGYYRNYIRDFFSAITQPLTDLLQKSKPNQFVWTDNEVTAFKALKNSMIHAPVFRNPDFHRPFILQTAASDFAIGAVLSQKFENGEHPIAFLSRKLLPRERNYSVVEKECLAIVWSTESLNYYLSGQKFTIQTDHIPQTRFLVYNYFI